MTCPVATLVTVIWAPLITAPEGSLTAPTMLPVPTVVCANKGKAVFTTVTRTRARINGNALAVVLMMVQLTAADSYGGGDP